MADDRPILRMNTATRLREGGGAQTHMSLQFCVVSSLSETPT